MTYHYRARRKLALSGDLPCEEANEYIEKLSHHGFGSQWTTAPRCKDLCVPFVETQQLHPRAEIIRHAAALLVFSALENGEDTDVTLPDGQLIDVLIAEGAGTPVCILGSEASVRRGRLSILGQSCSVEDLGIAIVPLLQGDNIPPEDVISLQVARMAPAIKDIIRVSRGVSV